MEKLSGSANSAKKKVRIAGALASNEKLVIS
jgi:hypothetical protein